MADFPSLPRMPGTDAEVAADDFDPGEIAGMRSAGWILLATVVISILIWIVSPVLLAPIAIGVDLVLGIQLLRLRHSWRAWTLLRAAVGVLLGVLIALAGLANQRSGAAVIGLGQIVYCGSLLLLLFGMPTIRRVGLGRAVFAVSAILLIAGGLLIGTQPPAAKQAGESQPLREGRLGSVPVRVAGPAADELTADDLEHIGALTSQSGKPWLVIGYLPEQSGPRALSANLFLEPDNTTPELRRGRFVLLTGLLGSGTGPERFRTAGWKTVDTSTYAQVPEQANDRFKVTHEDDLDRPFMILEGNGIRLADRDIISVVEFIRSNPKAPQAQSSGSSEEFVLSEDVRGTWPLDRMIGLAPDTIEVWLTDPRASFRSGQRVVVRGGNEAWTVIKVSLWAL